MNSEIGRDMWLFKADIRAIIYVIYKMKETENWERERESERVELDNVRKSRWKVNYIIRFDYEIR